MFTRDVLLLTLTRQNFISPLRLDDESDKLSSDVKTGDDMLSLSHPESGETDSFKNFDKGDTPPSSAVVEELLAGIGSETVVPESDNTND